MRQIDYAKYFKSPDPGVRERAWAWATAIGLQNVDHLSVSEFLLGVARRHIEGEITQEEARRLIDEHYDGPKKSETKRSKSRTRCSSPKSSRKR